MWWGQCVQLAILTAPSSRAAVTPIRDVVFLGFAIEQAHPRALGGCPIPPIQPAVPAVSLFLPHGSCWEEEQGGDIHGAGALLPLPGVRVAPLPDPSVAPLSMAQHAQPLRGAGTSGITPAVIPGTPAAAQGWAVPMPHKNRVPLHGTALSCEGSAQGAAPYGCVASRRHEHPAAGPRSSMPMAGPWAGSCATTSAACSAETLPRRGGGSYVRCDKVPGQPNGGTRLPHLAAGAIWGTACRGFSFLGTGGSPTRTRTQLTGVVATHLVLRILIPSQGWS